MEHFWIVLTVMAAFLQAIRTAAQRDLNKTMSTLATTYVRSLFGLPILAIYLAAVLAATGESGPPLSLSYMAWTFTGAMAQVVATMLLIRMFRLRSFGVGTMLTKSDVIITAIMGSLFFSEKVSAGGAAALVVILAGVVVMSMARTGVANLAGSGGLLATLFDEPQRVAFGCACSFSVSYLALREATLVMGGGTFLWRGGWTVLIAIAMQTVIVGIWLWFVEPKAFAQLRTNLKLSTFIGVTSAIGSIGWFTAFALQNASYVRAVGQVEVVFTLLISWLYFRERITSREGVGITFAIVGVVMFRLWA